MSDYVVIIGAGGHAKVIADIVEKTGDKILGFLDDNKEKGTIIINDYRIIGDLNDIIEVSKLKKNIKFIIAIGDNQIRKKIAQTLDIKFYTAIHPSAQIGVDVKIGEGTVVMANVCINSSSSIGKHCIINTGAIVEHDNSIESYVHLSPRVALGGTVKVGECTHIGIGATVKNNIDICSNVVVGVGATVVKNIEEAGIYVGVPAKRMR